jgi:hypothetical protein
MEKRKIYCNLCKNDTWHDVVVNYRQEIEDAIWGYPQRNDAEILQCCGCQLLSFRSVTYPFAFQDPMDRPEETLYPERCFKERERQYFSSMPIEINTLYDETITAHDKGLNLLSIVGLRALIEAIVVDKLEKARYGNSIESKIEALSNIFGEEVINTLHEFKKMGNKAIHAQILPNPGDVHRALNVIEKIMVYFYGILDSAEAFHRLREETT